MSNINVVKKDLDPINTATQYAELHRPQFHFSPEKNWMNDPNGMVYYQGEYHLFYQYHPHSALWGPMHWGHAISKDLVHWEQLPTALYPDEQGTIFSGSAVVDWDNTSGLGTKENPPLVAIYTYHDIKAEQQGKIDFQTQAVAYSLDSGRTWLKYGKNPVLKNPGIKDFRDPKVSWHEESHKWVMVLAQDDHIGFYSSVNLIDWQLESTFGKEWGVHAGVWECPDLIKMPVEGTEQYNYVLLVSINPGGPNGGSATQYFVGNFDGSHFTLTDNFKQDVKQVTTNDGLQESAVWLDYGTDNYAGVTFSDVNKADGRAIFMGWMSNWQYANDVPTEEWRSAMTIPRSLYLRKSAVGLRLASQPIQELEQLVNNTHYEQELIGKSKYDLLKVNTGDNLYRLELDVIPMEATTFSITFTNQLGEEAVLSIDVTDGVVNFDRSRSGKVDFKKGFDAVQSAITTKGLTKYSFDIYVDHSSFEIFINDGATVITSIVFPSIPYSSATITAESNITIHDLSVSELNSIW